MRSSGWFGVRCVFDLGTVDAETGSAAVAVTRYEERVTIWRATGFEQAIELAEAEAEDYAGDLDVRYTGLAQAYAMVDPPGEGAEVFSLLRDSSLATTDYLTAYFDTGTERTGQLD